MLSVDGTQVTAADRRRAHSQNHLTVSSTWIRNLANIDLTATWEENTPQHGSVPAYWTLALNIGQLTCCFVTTDAGSVALQVTTTKIAVPTRRLSTSPGERSHMVETHHRAAFRFAESGNPFNHTLKRKVSAGVRRRPKPDYCGPDLRRCLSSVITVSQNRRAKTGPQAVCPLRSVIALTTAQGPRTAPRPRPRRPLGHPLPFRPCQQSENRWHLARPRKAGSDSRSPYW